MVSVSVLDSRVPSRVHPAGGTRDGGVGVGGDEAAACRRSLAPLPGSSRGPWSGSTRPRLRPEGDVVTPGRRGHGRVGGTGRGRRGQPLIVGHDEGDRLRPAAGVGVRRGRAGAGGRRRRSPRRRTRSVPGAVSLDAEELNVHVACGQLTVNDATGATFGLESGSAWSTTVHMVALALATRWSRCARAMAPTATGAFGSEATELRSGRCRHRRRCCAGSGRRAGSSRWSSWRTCRPSRTRRTSQRSPRWLPGVVCVVRFAVSAAESKAATGSAPRCRRRRAASATTSWSRRR